MLLPRPLFLLSAARGCRLLGSEGLTRRSSYKVKPAAEGGSTAGQYRQCTYICGFGKAAVPDDVDFLPERCWTPCPRWLPPRQATQGHRVQTPVKYWY